MIPSKRGKQGENVHRYAVRGKKIEKEIDGGSNTEREKRERRKESKRERERWAK